MSGIIGKAKEAIQHHQGHTTDTPLEDENEKLPGNFVAVPGGSYDAGPGVTEPGRSQAPIESASHTSDAGGGDPTPAVSESGLNKQNKHDADGQTAGLGGAASDKDKGKSEEHVVKEAAGDVGGEQI